MEQKSVDNRKLYMFAFKAFGDFSGTIAIPAVAAALLGKWLDSRYATEPKIMIALLIIAFALTALVIVKKTKEYGREYQELFTEEGRNT